MDLNNSRFFKLTMTKKILVILKPNIRTFHQVINVYQSMDEDGAEEPSWTNIKKRYITPDGVQYFTPNTEGCTWKKIEFPIRNRITGQIFETNEELVTDLNKVELITNLNTYCFSTEEFFIRWDGQKHYSTSIKELDEVTEDFLGLTKVGSFYEGVFINYLMFDAKNKKYFTSTINLSLEGQFEFLVEEPDLDKLRKRFIYVLDNFISSDLFAQISKK